jgi:hypothetical protein
MPRFRITPKRQAVIDAVVTFQDRVFPTATIKSAAAHLLKEAGELEEHPDDKLEMADVWMLAVGILAHITAHARKRRTDLMKAVRQKIAINYRRRWVESDVPGLFEHARDEAPKPTPEQLHDLAYPEHVKLRAVRDQSQIIGQFLDWTQQELRAELRVWCEEPGVYDYIPVTIDGEYANIERLLARYFDIDLQKIAAEKDQMLADIRQHNELSERLDL